MNATLYIVATPLGNLGDMSERGIETLKSVDLILAEDTRNFSRLSSRFDITTPVKSYHEHNELDAAERAISELQEGRTIALVSDAGTPTISDPGYRLVSAAREAEVPVVTIPGPCAAIAALSISGFETDRFTFVGFLPTKPGKRKTALEEALDSKNPTIAYESPHRILKTLDALRSLDETRQVFIGRELTKRYEESLVGTAAEIYEELSSRKSIPGEIVLIIRGHGKKKKGKV